jgi:hypothetical protein
VFAATE